MKLSRVLRVVALPAVIAACVPPAPPPAIQGELMFNKYGGAVGCTEGQYIPGAPPEFQCRPPDDQCDPQYSTFDPDCPPPGRPSDNGNGQVPGLPNDPGGGRVPGTPNDPTGGFT